WLEGLEYCGEARHSRSQPVWGPDGGAGARAIERRGANQAGPAGWKRRDVRLHETARFWIAHRNRSRGRIAGHLETRKSLATVFNRIAGDGSGSRRHSTANGQRILRPGQRRYLGKAARSERAAHARWHA